MFFSACVFLPPSLVPFQKNSDSKRTFYFERPYYYFPALVEDKKIICLTVYHVNQHWNHLRYLQKQGPTDFFNFYRLGWILYGCIDFFLILKKDFYRLKIHFQDQKKSVHP